MSKHPKSFFLDRKYNEKQNECITLILSDFNYNDIYPKPDFDVTGHCFNVYELVNSFKPVIHFVYFHKAALHKTTISYKTLAWADKSKTMFDPKNTCCFSFHETYPQCVDIYGIFFDDLKNTPKEVQPSLNQPDLTLNLKGLNQFRYQLLTVGKENYIVVIANGWKYGWKVSHVDYSQGCTIDLIKYTKEGLVEHFKKIKIDPSFDEFKSNTFPKVFIDNSSEILYCYSSYRNCVFELDFDETVPVLNELPADDSIQYFEHCIDAVFVYVTHHDQIVRLIKLCKGEVNVLKQHPLRISGEGNDVTFNNFCLYKQYKKFYLGMQSSDFKVKYIDLFNGDILFQISLEYPVRSLCLNWNMREVAITRVNSEDNLCCSVYYINTVNLSLKHMARLAVLTTFSEDYLSQSYLPATLKEFLGL